MTRRPEIQSPKRHRHGRALAVEIALLVPAMVLLAFAGFEWGGYFWLQHEVQQAAEDALAAAKPAPNELAARVAASTAVARRLQGGVADLSLDFDAPRSTVRVAYDASSSPIFAIRRLVPLPPPVLVGIAAPR